MRANQISRKKMKKWEEADGSGNFSTLFIPLLSHLHIKFDSTLMVTLTPSGFFLSRIILTVLSFMQNTGTQSMNYTVWNHDKHHLLTVAHFSRIYDLNKACANPYFFASGCEIIINCGVFSFTLVPYSLSRFLHLSHVSQAFVTRCTRLRKAVEKIRLSDLKMGV